MLHQGRVEGKKVTRGREFINRARLLGYEIVEKQDQIMTTRIVPPAIQTNFDPFIDPSNEQATRYYLHKMVNVIDRGEIQINQLPDPKKFNEAVAYYGIRSELRKAEKILRNPMVELFYAPQANRRETVPRREPEKVPEEVPEEPAPAPVPVEPEHEPVPAPVPEPAEPKKVPAGNFRFDEITPVFLTMFAKLRGKILPGYLLSQLSTHDLVDILSKLLGEAVYSEKAGILPPTIESRLTQTFGEGRLTTTPQFQNWMQGIASDQGRVLLDSAWLERLIEKSPRALYILLTALQKFQGDRKVQEPLIDVVGDEKSLTKSLERALLRKENGLNWEERLETKHFLIPRLKNLIHVISHEAISSYVEAHDYGIATLGTEFLSNLPLGAQFILNPQEVSGQDLVAIAFVVLALLKAAALVRGIKKNPIEQARILKPYLQQIIPGASSQGAQGFIVQLAQYIQQVLISSKLVEASA